MTALRGSFGYGLSQWETTLHCNGVSHWLNPYPEWSLLWHLQTQWWLGSGPVYTTLRGLCVTTLCDFSLLQGIWYYWQKYILLVKYVPEWMCANAKAGKLIRVYLCALNLTIPDLAVPRSVILSVNSDTAKVALLSPEDSFGLQVNCRCQRLLESIKTTSIGKC